VTPDKHYKDALIEHGIDVQPEEMRAVLERLLQGTSSTVRHQIWSALNLLRFRTEMLYVARLNLDIAKDRVAGVSIVKPNDSEANHQAASEMARRQSDADLAVNGYEEAQTVVRQLGAGLSKKAASWREKQPMLRRHLETYLESL
jgi:hypothetical protein